MAEYITKESVIQAFEWGDVDVFEDCGDDYTSGFSRDAIKNIINSIPAADVTSIVHGRWVRPHWNNSNYCCDCSECGGEAMHRDYQWHKNGVYPICPNCGAKMFIKNKGDNDATKEID